MIYDLIHHITKHNLTEGQTPCEAPSFSPSLRTTSSLPTDCQSAPYGLRVLRYAAILILMMVLGVNSVWCQVGKDFSGTYYIANHNRKGSTGYDGYSSDINKNFYLCPSTIMYDEDQPFLTTNKERSTTTPQNTNAKWTIKFAKTEGNVDYYYLIHSTDKYLTWHDPMEISDKGNATDRVRLHLQSTLNEDKALFYFTEGTLGENDYNICLKDENCSKNTPGSLNPAKDNVEGYEGVKNNWSNAGSFIDRIDRETKRWCGGLIGIYEQNDPTGVWYLEDYITRPTISYNSDNKIVITSVQTGEGITIKYTTNGTTPTSENGTVYAEAFDPPANTTMIKAIVIVNDEESNVATFTPAFFLGKNHKYLIQSQGNGWTTGSFQGNHYYMIPGDVENNITKVNTTSMFRPSMQWYFLNAGDNYYYIVNNVDDTRMRYNTTSGIHMDTWDDNNANEFKFQIVESATAGTYNIIPYGVTADKKYFNKTSGNAGDGALTLYNSATDGNSRWKFVKKNALVKTAPFTVTDNKGITYYKLQNKATSYYVAPPSFTGGAVTASNSTAADVVNSRNWYFEVAQESSDADWLTWYYIRNAVTGDYLYYSGPNPSNDAAAFITKGSLNEAATEEAMEDMKRYRFTWARSATENNYFIVPQLLKDESQNTISGLNRNSTTLRIFKSKSVDGSLWQFVAPDYTGAPPNIVYNADVNTVSLSCTTPGATIYYTTNNTEATTSATNSGSSTITIDLKGEGKENVTIIRAIAEASGTSSSETTNNFIVQATVASVKRPYLIRNNQSPWTVGSEPMFVYYMIPSDVDNGNTTVNTTSMPRPTMEWYFEHADKADGKQYYYIVNTITGDYLYRTGTAIYMKTSSEKTTLEAASDNGFKFYLISRAASGSNHAGYSIVPYGETTTNFVSKASGNNNAAAVKLEGTDNDYKRWNFVTKTDLMNDLAAKLPFTPSSGSSSIYYKIQNGKMDSDNKPYYIIPPASIPGNAEASKSEDAAVVKSGSWYFVKVQDPVLENSDPSQIDWLTYYKIVNAETGKVLYYNFTASTSPCIKVGDYVENDGNYMFAFVKSPTTDYYYIVPKTAKDNQLANISCFWRDGSNMKPATTRGTGNNVWSFTPVTLFCNAPEFIEEDGKIRIKCNTNAANIYINTESDADPTSGSTLYDPTDPNNATTQNWAITDKVRIKAIAIVSDGTTPASSSVISLLNNPDITLSQDTYTYDGTAKQPVVNEVSIGEAPNKTTATAGTDFETVIATDYSNNINAGTAKVTLRDKASNVYVWHAEKVFTINKKDLTATADNITVSYGDDVPTYTISYTGFENSEDASAVTTPPTITCAYTSTSDVNTYPISVNTDGVATNYNIIPGTPGTLTVNQREVGLTWGTTPIIYNGTPQAPTATATNLVNEDVIGVTVDGAQTNAGGDYTATASALTGDKKDNYRLPTENTQTFTISKRPVTVSGITASDKEYDGTTAATLVLTGATFADGDIIGTDNVTIESATGAFADANAGAGKTVTISAITLGGSSVSNYEFAGSGQQTETTAKITKASLTATADNQTVTFGDAAPTYTITYAGWKNGESETVLTSEPTASSEYTQGSNVGSYPITVTGGVATNYAITNQNGTLTVGPKTLTQDNISFGEGGIVVVKDGETTLTEGTDYTIGEEQHSGINNKYTVTPVIGKNDGTSSGTGNYTGTVSIRHANVHLTTGANQANYSATFVAESAGATDIGHVLPEGFTAYIISGIEGSWAIPEPMDYIPAGVPVLLVAHEEKTGFLVRDAKSENVTDISEEQIGYNKLKEVTAESAHFNTRQIYVLYKNEFVLNKEGDLAKGKVYMENPKYVAPSPSSPAPANLSIAWGNVTGIEDGRWKMEDGNNEHWYTLDGRCLIGKPTAKGLYIVNGKKRVVK